MSGTSKPWQVTLPYDDVRAMEAQAELLCEIQTELIILTGWLKPDSVERSKSQSLVAKIRKAQQT